MDCVLVLPDTCQSLEHPGCWESVVFLYPEVVYFNGSGLTLAPGECRTWTETWDGLVFNDETGAFELPPPGRYTALGGLFRWTGAIDFQVPDAGVPLKIFLNQTSAVGVERKTWGNLKAHYQGHIPH